MRGSVTRSGSFSTTLGAARGDPPTDDRWQLDVTAWLRNPSDVPKLYALEVPEPVGRPNSMYEDLPFTLEAPAPPTERRSLIHNLTIHVLDVVDKMVPFMELRPDFETCDDEDLTQRHDYSRSCYRGRVDDTGRDSCLCSGGHPFSGLDGLGVAGDSGGGQRLNDLFLPTGGIAAPFLHGPGSVARSGTTVRASVMVVSPTLAPTSLRGPVMDSVARSSATVGASITMITHALAWSVPEMVVCSAASGPPLLEAWPCCWGGPRLGGCS
ncbi:hypothetical protein D1007_35767 [Hordeum vulgare]|nr:hypothetical protein D1007_35767 [Hordeum vulgare]